MDATEMPFRQRRQTNISARRNENRPRMFGLKSCRDVLEKLTREVDRLRSATIDVDASDHAINCGMTAWHMTRWVWAEINDRPELLVRLAKAAGITPQDFDLDAFRNYVVARLGLSGKYAAPISNAGKPGGGRDRKGETEFETVNTTTLVVLQSTSCLTAIPDTISAFAPKVIDERGRRALIGNIDAMVGFWTAFLADNNIEALS